MGRVPVLCSHCVANKQEYYGKGIVTWKTVGSFQHRAQTLLEKNKTKKKLVNGSCITETFLWFVSSSLWPFFLCRKMDLIMKQHDKIKFRGYHMRLCLPASSVWDEPSRAYSINQGCQVSEKKTTKKHWTEKKNQNKKILDQKIWALDKWEYDGKILQRPIVCMSRRCLRGSCRFIF